MNNEDIVKIKSFISHLEQDKVETMAPTPEFVREVESSLKIIYNSNPTKQNDISNAINQCSIILRGQENTDETISLSYFTAVDKLTTMLQNLITK